MCIRDRCQSSQECHTQSAQRQHDLQNGQHECDAQNDRHERDVQNDPRERHLSLIHISEPTRLALI
eukprot:2526421-Alexandrium_andersonii.AAC.1